MPILSWWLCSQILQPRPGIQIVAPLAPREAMPDSGGGPLRPMVAVQGAHHVVFVPRVTPLRSRDWGGPVGSIAAARGPLLTAVDFLFFGV